MKKFELFGSGLSGNWQVRQSPPVGESDQYVDAVDLESYVRLYSLAVTALKKVSENKNMCVYGTYDMEPEPEKAFRQGSHIAFNQSAEVADEALKELEILQR